MSIRHSRREKDGREDNLSTHPLTDFSRRLMAKRFSGTAVTVFFAALVISLGLTCVIINNRLKLDKAAMERLIAEKTIAIKEVMSALLYKTQALAALVIQSDGQIDTFDNIAAALIDDPAINNLLVAPGGVVSHVYPLKGNERVLGYDLLGPGEGNKEAKFAKEKDSLVIGGPFNLVQGGQAIVGRLPVWLDSPMGKRFWGLVSVTLRYPEALAGAHLGVVDSLDYRYELWRINPDNRERQIIAASKQPYDASANYVESRLPIFNANWYLRILPVRSWYQYAENWAMLVGCLLTSLFLARIAQNKAEFRILRQELRRVSTTDPLTGLLNRGGLMESLEKLIDAGTPFQLFYLDIDHFRRVNNRYGNRVGDQLLIEFGKRIAFHTSGDFLLARVDGDEFVLVRDGQLLSEREIAALWEKVDMDFVVPFDTDAEVDLYISCRRGMVTYPEDGCDPYELLAQADRRMFKSRDTQYLMEKRRWREEPNPTEPSLPGEAS